MTDMFSTIVDSIQIVGQCAKATGALARWINQTATVDQRIRSFYDDVAKLQETYRSLEQCSNDLAVTAAAKAANESTENLWIHLRVALEDCQDTLVAINQILAEIDKPLGLSAHLRQFVAPPVKQLHDQLSEGELGHHRETIRMFNTGLVIPMLMIQITLQLQQSDLSEEYYRGVEDRLVVMHGTIDKLNANIAKLQRPKSLKRVQTSASGAIIDDQDGNKDVCKNMEEFAKSAKHFLSNASSTLSSKSGESTIVPDYTLALRYLSEKGTPLAQRDRKRMDTWVAPIKDDSNPSFEGSEDAPASIIEYDDDDTDDEDFELDEVRKYFEHGQSHLARGNFADAEENFVEALEVLQNNDFGDRIAFQSADIILILAHCFVEQDRLDKAIESLLPLTNDSAAEDGVTSPSQSLQSPSSDKKGTRPDPGRTYAAHYSIGTIYMKKEDYDNAAKHGIIAYKGRKKLFGKGHEKTIEAVQLVVDAFRAKGKRAKADFWETHLVSDADNHQKLSQQGQRHPNNAHPGLTASARPSISSLPTSITPALPVASPPPPLTSPTLPFAFPMPPLAGPVAPITIPTALPNTGTIMRMSNESYVTNSAVTGPIPVSIFDGTRRSSSITAASIQQAAATKARQDLKSKFDAVKTLAKISKDKAWNEAKEILKEYDPKPYKILLHRRDELKKNIKEQGATKGMSATGSGYAPIHFFCELKTEHVTEVELLIEGGADLMSLRWRPGYVKQDPMTPLQMAIERGYQTLAVMMIDALLTSSVPMTQLLALRDPEDLSPLLAACRLGQVETVARFLELGAVMTSGFPRTNWVGNSLLHDAASQCDTDMVNLLTSIRVERNGSRQRHDIGNIDQQDQFGRTPFMYAVMSKNIPDQPKRDRKLKRRLKCVEVILQHAGPDLGHLFAVQDNQQHDVWSYAEDEDDFQLTQLLNRYGCGAKELDVNP